MIDDLLSNLFRNSISTVDPPTVEMELEVKPWEYNKVNGYLLSLMDNGSGIPDEVKDRVLSCEQEISSTDTKP